MTKVKHSPFILLIGKPNTYIFLIAGH